MDSANTLVRIQIKRTYRSPLFLWESSTSLHNAKQSSPPTDVTSAGWINAMNASTSEVTPYLLPPAPYRNTNRTIYQLETLEVFIMCSPTFPSLSPGRLFGLHTNIFCIWIFSIKLIYLFWNEAHNIEWSLSTRKRLKSYNTLKQRGVNVSLWVFFSSKKEGLCIISVHIRGMKKQDYATFIRYLTAQSFVWKKASHWLKAAFQIASYKTKFLWGIFCIKSGFILAVKYSSSSHILRTMCTPSPQAPRLRLLTLQWICYCPKRALDNEELRVFLSFHAWVHHNGCKQA